MIVFINLVFKTHTHTYEKEEEHLEANKYYLIIKNQEIRSLSHKKKLKKINKNENFYFFLLLKINENQKFFFLTQQPNKKNKEEKCMKRLEFLLQNL